VTILIFVLFTHAPAWGIVVYTGDAVITQDGVEIPSEIPTSAEAQAAVAHLFQESRDPPVTRKSLGTLIRYLSDAKDKNHVREIYRIFFTRLPQLDSNLMPRVLKTLATAVEGVLPVADPELANLLVKTLNPIAQEIANNSDSISASVTLLTYFGADNLNVFFELIHLRRSTFSSSAQNETLFGLNRICTEKLENELDRFLNKNSVAIDRESILYALVLTRKEESYAEEILNTKNDDLIFLFLKQHPPNNENFPLFERILKKNISKTTTLNVLNELREMAEDASSQNKILQLVIPFVDSSIPAVKDLAIATIRQCWKNPNENAENTMLRLLIQDAELYIKTAVQEILSNYDEANGARLRRKILDALKSTKNEPSIRVLVDLLPTIARDPHFRNEVTGIIVSLLQDSNVIMKKYVVSLIRWEKDLKIPIQPLLDCYESFSADETAVDLLELIHQQITDKNKDAIIQYFRSHPKAEDYLLRDLINPTCGNSVTAVVPLTQLMLENSPDIAKKIEPAIENEGEAWGEVMTILLSLPHDSAWRKAKEVLERLTEGGELSPTAKHSFESVLSIVTGKKLVSAVPLLKDVFLKSADKFRKQHRTLRIGLTNVKYFGKNLAKLSQTLSDLDTEEARAALKEIASLAEKNLTTDDFESQSYGIMLLGGLPDELASPLWARAIAPLADRNRPLEDRYAFYKYRWSVWIQESNEIEAANHRKTLEVFYADLILKRPDLWDAVYPGGRSSEYGSHSEYDWLSRWSFEYFNQLMIANERENTRELASTLLKTFIEENPVAVSKKMTDAITGFQEDVRKLGIEIFTQYLRGSLFLDVAVELESRIGAPHVLEFFAGAKYSTNAFAYFKHAVALNDSELQTRLYQMLNSQPSLPPDLFRMILQTSADQSASGSELRRALIQREAKTLGLTSIIESLPLQNSATFRDSMRLLQSKLPELTEHQRETLRKNLFSITHGLTHSNEISSVQSGEAVSFLLVKLLSEKKFLEQSPLLNEQEWQDRLGELQKKNQTFAQQVEQEAQTGQRTKAELLLMRYLMIQKMREVLLAAKLSASQTRP
jgi:hypothetical protein